MATHHRLAERSDRSAPHQAGCRHLRRRDLRARRAFAPASRGWGAQGRLIAFDKDAEAMAEAARGSPMRVFPSGTRASARWASCPGQRRRRADGPGRELAADRQPGARFQFSFRRPAGHAHGHHARRERGRVAGNAELQQIAEVIRDYGEERFAVQVAKAIVARRQERGPLATTTELAELVAGTVKTREPGQDPATRTFQALRIFINAELEELQQALEASLSCCNPEAASW
jgi:16S rRNA (cytosine1402-N4)-methyltransferase